MAASHHDREEETLISYFQQMLAEVDDQEFDGEIQATSGALEAPAPQVQPDTQAVLAAANAAIAQSHAIQPAAPAAPQPTPTAAPTTEPVDPDNPFAGMPRISTQEMLAQEMIMVEEPEEEVAAPASAAPEPMPAAPEPTPAASEPVTVPAAPEPVAATPVYEETAAYAPEGGYSVAPYEPTPEPMLQTEPEAAPSRDFAQPDEQLQRLLEKIDTSDPAVQTQVALSAKIAEATPQIATKVAEPQVATAVAEPQVETQVEVAEPQVATAVAEPVVETKVEVAPVAAPVVTTTQQKVMTPQELAQERMRAKLQAISANWRNVDLGAQFQVLFFLVQGVRFAVPLIDLGGIFECDKITQLFGKPSWFMGITDVRGAKINIVDTLRWVMPEIGDSPDKYPYLISLGKSQWSIGCDVLEGNRTLTSSQIKWREIPGNRPWLAGIVTSEKCALLHVSALIALFEAGADIDDLKREAQAEIKEKQHKA